MKKIILAVIFLSGNLFAEDVVLLQHVPENIKARYKMVSVTEDGDRKNIKEDLFDLPMVVESDLSAHEIDEIVILARGLPVHLPKEAVYVDSVWYGRSSYLGFILNHKYKLSGFKVVDRERCAEVDYKITSVMADKYGFEGDGRFLFDLDRGIIIAHVWDANLSSKKISYASILKH